jgi:hypothetical protein
MKLSATILAAGLALAFNAATAGVAPTLGNSAAAQSGANVAPAKTQQDQAHEDQGAKPEESK